MDTLSRLAHFPKMTMARWRNIASNLAREQYDMLFELPASFFVSIGWSGSVAEEFVKWREIFDEHAAENILLQEGIRVITIGSTEYPSLLAQLYDPPFALFVRGKLTMGNVPIAVVGTRAMTTYGRQITQEIVGALARVGCTIVSGLALGIDGEAHRTAIHNGGITVAVLGTGNDRAHVYPAMHRTLANDIVDSGGAVITEYAPGSKATAYSFPARNRIIAGLSLGTLVVEAGESSGALITASVAVENGRDVFAVPQNITSPTSIGPHQLLKNGAHLVTSAEDIYSVYGIVSADTIALSTQSAPVSGNENAVLTLLSRSPVHIDAIIHASGLTGPTVMSTLTVLEVKGYIKNMGNMMYIRV